MEGMSPCSGLWKERRSVFPGEPEDRLCYPYCIPSPWAIAGLSQGLPGRKGIEKE